jgi:hypothetical protein
LLYIFRSPEMSAADERAFAAMRQLHLRTSDDKVMSVTLKKILREQYLMLQVNEEAALNDLPLLLPEEPEARQQALGIVRQVAGATGTLTGEAAARLERIAASSAARRRWRWCKKKGRRRPQRSGLRMKTLSGSSG